MQHCWSPKIFSDKSCHYTSDKLENRSRAVIDSYPWTLKLLIEDKGIGMDDDFNGISIEALDMELRDFI